MALFKDDSGIKDGTDADDGLEAFGGGRMSKYAASLSLSPSSSIRSKLKTLWGLYTLCWDKAEDPRKSGSAWGIRVADSNDTGSGTLATSFCARLAGPRIVPRAENLEGMMLPDGFEEFELREPPLRYVWQEDATGEYITLAEVSGPLRKALEATEETVGCLLYLSKSGGKKPCLASCFRGDREISLRPFVSGK